MSQTNNNTNNGQNKNQISERGGQGQIPGGRGRGDCRNNPGNNSITNKYSFKGKITDSLISKLIVPETWQKPTQYKKVINILSALCVDKNYQGLNDVIWNEIDLVEANSHGLIQTKIFALPLTM